MKDDSQIAPVPAESAAGSPVGGSLKSEFANDGAPRIRVNPFYQRLAALILLMVLCALAWWLNAQGMMSTALISGFFDHHPIGATALFLAIHGLATIALLPTLPLNLIAGIIWGPIFGGALSSIGSTLGAMVAFWVARLIIGQPLAKRTDQKLLAWLQREMTQGWRFIAFLRLNPIFPTGPLNYLLGLTGIPFSTYAWSTLAFLLPPGIAVAFIGEHIRMTVVNGDMATTWFAILAASAAIVALILMSRVARLFYAQESR